LALAAHTSAMVRTRTQQTIGIITGEVVTFTVLTRDHLENRQPKKLFSVLLTFLFSQGVFPSGMKFLHMCTITIIIKFQPKHTAQPITYDQPTFSIIRSHSPLRDQLQSCNENHLKPLAKHNRNRAVFHCC
jgi:hypothetical protein